MKSFKEYFELSKKDPCWKGYEMIGKKKKGKKKVPNCVPIQEENKPLNKPFRNKDGKPKKFSVYVKNGDNIKKVNFGDPNMSIKRDNKDNRKSFRARHKCDEKKDKTTPGYWSCKFWSKTPVSKLV